MKPYLYIIVLAVGFVSISCNRSVDSNKCNYIIKQDSMLHLGDFLSDSLIIPLETNDICLLNDISKIVISNSKLYITDESSNKIFVFQLNGKYFSQIDKLGRGPGEYLDIRDFEVQDGKIYILSRGNKKIFVYDDLGNYAYELELDERYNRLSFMDNHNIILYSEQSNNSLLDFAIYNLNAQKIIAQFDPFSVNESYSIFYTPFHKSNERVLITKPFDNNVYELSNNSLTPIYSFKFELGDQYPENHLSMKLEELNHFTRTKDILKWIEYVADFDKSIIIVYLSNNREYGLRQNIAYIDKKTSETKGIRLGDTIDEQFLYFFNVIGVSNNVLISAIPSFIYLNRCEIYKVDNKLNIKDTDNPIISIYKIKNK